MYTCIFYKMFVYFFVDFCVDLFNLCSVFGVYMRMYVQCLCVCVDKQHMRIYWVCDYILLIMNVVGVYEVVAVV